MSAGHVTANFHIGDFSRPLARLSVLPRSREGIPAAPFEKNWGSTPQQPVDQRWLKWAGILVSSFRDANLLI